MKYWIVLFALVFGFMSCEDDPFTTDAFYVKNSNIRINGIDTLSAEIIPGNKEVFQIQYTTEAENGSVVSIEGIIFEVDPQDLSIDYEGFLLQDAFSYFYRECNCPDAGYFPILQGYIGGVRKSNDEWEMNITVQGPNFNFIYQGVVKPM